MTMCWNDPEFDNQSRAVAVRQAVEAKGGVFTIWLTRPFTASTARTAVEAAGVCPVILEGEIPGHRPEAVDWQACVDELGEILSPSQCSVATNFAPFVHADGTPWPEKAKPLVDAGWKCLTECYDMGAGNPSIWPELRGQFAVHLGWDETQPILGTYEPPGGAGSLEAFPSRNNYRNWSVWDAGSEL